MEVQTSSHALTLPPPEVLRQIEAKQNAKAKEIQERRKQQSSPDAQDAAAKVIQKNYRGYRTRRALQGFGIDPGARWVEVLKEAKYYNLTSPVSRKTNEALSPGSEAQIRARWKRVGTIAHRAGSDDTSSDSDMVADDPEELAKLKERKWRQKKEREKYAKIMGLDYFLEMIDHKHRYGSNLRRYHAEWKKASTNENFFYWLDYGEGKDLDLEDRPRSRLDSEFVRYLSKDDRQKYLVKIDKEGRFCWAKNDCPISTSVDFRDSIDGIVPVEDETPTWREVTTGVKKEPEGWGSSDSASISSGLSMGSQENESKYGNTEVHDAEGLSKVGHLNDDAITKNHLRKPNKNPSWIFVADTSFRLYIGIKQSGAFQHSSFLRGARVSAAGQIKIKRGQLRKISPLSGHYAPPVRNFREFMKSLKEEGADLRGLNTGRSYAVLLGLEGWVGAKKKVKGVEREVRDLVDPEGKRERKEEERDKSASAEREREVMRRQEEERKRRGLSYRIKRKLGFDGKEKDASDGQ